MFSIDGARANERGKELLTLGPPLFAIRALCLKTKQSPFGRKGSELRSIRSKPIWRPLRKRPELILEKTSYQADDDASDLYFARFVPHGRHAGVRGTQFDRFSIASV